MLLAFLLNVEMACWRRSRVLSGADIKCKLCLLRLHEVAFLLAQLDDDVPSFFLCLS